VLGYVDRNQRKARIGVRGLKSGSMAAFGPFETFPLALRMSDYRDSDELHRKVAR